MIIRGLEEIEIVQSFCLIKEKNKHSICKITGIITEVEHNNFDSKIGKKVDILYDAAEDKTVNTLVVFHGLIQEFVVEKTFSFTKISVTASSYSVLVDQSPRMRIFQNPGKNVGDILNNNQLALQECELIISPELAKLPVPEIVIQNFETDFAFVNRLAAKYGYSVWMQDTLKDKIRIAKDTGTVSNLSEQRDVIAYRQVMGQNRNRLNIRANKYLELGRILRIDNNLQEYIISKMEIRLVNEAYEFWYELDVKEKDSTKVQIENLYAETGSSPFYNNSCEVLKLKARVTNVKDPDNMGRIQVEFITPPFQDMNQRDGKRTWLEYRSPYSGKTGGIVFIPDIGDIVEVFYKNGECFINSTFRQQPLNDECVDTTNKYIGNNFQQRIIWKEDSLQLRSADNYICLTGDRIELVVGKNKIVMDAEQIQCATIDTTLALSKDTVLITKGKVQIDSKKTFVNAQDNIAIHGQNVNVDGSGNIKVKSGNVLTLNGSSRVNIS